MDTTLIYKAKAGTIKQKRALVVLSENIGMPIYRAMRLAGYSHQTASTPARLTKSKGFQELLEETLPDSDLLNVHKSLLTTKRIDHMVFPLGPKDEDDPNMSGSDPNATNPLDGLDHPVERTTLSDQEITDMLAGVGGTVKRIVHGQTARHVYFWVANDKARHDALKLAYDLKGRLTKTEPIVPGPVYNSTLNINAPSARQLADETLKILMDRTKRKVVPNGNPS